MTRQQATVIWILITFFSLNLEFSPRDLLPFDPNLYGCTDLFTPYILESSFEQSHHSRRDLHGSRLCSPGTTLFSH